MKIIELYVENFGKLHDFRHSLTDGLNIINEENGFGKTTLSVFIKAMLFGLEDTRRAKIEENERKHYTPWGGGVFGGTLTFVHGGKKYRIERTFGAKGADDTFTLYDCESGRVTDDFGANIGEEIFGINADGFERTVLLSEKRLSVKNDNKTISAKLSDLVGCDGDVGALDDAIEALEERRKYYQKRGGGGRIGDIRKLITELDVEINDLERLGEGIPGKDARLEGLGREAAELEERLGALDARAAMISHEGKYLARKAALDEAKKQAAELENFFAAGIPTDEEIRAAQRNDEDLGELEKALVAVPDESARDSASEKLRAADKLIDGLKDAKNTPKALPVPVFFAVGALLFVGAVVFAVLTMFTPCAVMSCLGGLACVLGAMNAKKQRAAKENENEVREKINALLGESREGDMQARLIEFKVRLEAEIRELEAAAKEAAAKRERAEALRAARAEFLKKFPTESSNPYAEIADKRSALGYARTRVRELSAELADFVREYGIDEGALGRGAMPDGQNEAEREKISELLRAKRAERAVLEREIAREREALERLDELYEKKRELSDEYAGACEIFDTIKLTMEMLERAKDNLTARYLGPTREAFGRYIGALGGDEAELFTMDTSFGLMKSEGAKSMPTEAYSLGTREYFSLAARLALIDSLYEGEKPFIVLDDPFAHFDDKKYAAAMKLMCEMAKTRQIIYFTCTETRSA